MSKTEKLAKEAKLIVSGIALYPMEDGKILAVNLHNTHYRAKFTLDGTVICSNMGDDTLKKVREIVIDNIEFV